MVFNSMNDVKLALIEIQHETPILSNGPCSFFGCFDGDYIGLTTCKNSIIESNYIAFGLFYDPKEKVIDKCEIMIFGIHDEDAKQYHQKNEYFIKQLEEYIKQDFEPKEIVYKYSIHNDVSQLEVEVLYQGLKMFINSEKGKDGYISQIRIKLAENIIKDELEKFILPEDK